MRKAIAFAMAFGLAIALQAQPILSVDFDDRTGSAGLTEPGFDSFLIGTANGTGAQTTPTTRTFGSITLTISGDGPDLRYDDRARTTPANNLDFTQSFLLRDVVFSQLLTNEGGLNLLIEGLNPDEVYRVSIWSFDSGSVGSARVSDWDANGYRVRENYSFQGGQHPTSNTQYQIVFKVPASSTGQILVQGRRDAASGPNFAVFINALQVEPSFPELHDPVVRPVVADVFAGDNVVFTAEVNATVPYGLQWFREGNPLLDATNSTLTVFNVQPADPVGYALVVSNAVGTVTTAVSVIVTPVANLMSGFISHWPMDEATTVTPDAMTNWNHLGLVNMDASNIVPGYSGNALSFNGSNEMATLTHNGSGGLPVSSYPAYSVVLWVKGDYTNQNDRRVFAESANNNDLPLLNIGTHSQGSNGVVDIFIRNDNGVAPLNHRRSSLIAFDNNWHHIAWVDNNGYPTLYVDGQADTNNFNYTRGVLTPNIVAVGGILRVNPGNWFNGAIDQVAAWRRTLTPDEIAQVYSSGPPKPLRILSIQVASGTVTLTIHTPEPDSSHHIEEATDVTNPTWTEVQNVTFGPQANTFTAKFSAPSGTQRFYRVTY